MPKWIYKLFNPVFTFLFRITNGAFGSNFGGFTTLLLTTNGRKTDKKRTVPLGYFKDGPNYIIAASNSGSDKYPGWYFNIISNPEVSIQLRGGDKKVRAEIAKPAERERLWKKLVTEAPIYGRYEKQTTRIIPIVTLRTNN
ncbi:nitroreductase family deazaflavin-dependent oxidoreductase [Patescibacteria group bacterium]|nr:nitroreductase family deazaflavin-dependent oxidoreductase [Patescibacteria group bacterium]